MWQRFLSIPKDHGLTEILVIKHWNESPLNDEVFLDGNSMEPVLGGFFSAMARIFSIHVVSWPQDIHLGAQRGILAESSRQKPTGL